MGSSRLPPGPAPRRGPGRRKGLPRLLGGRRSAKPPPPPPPPLSRELLPEAALPFHPATRPTPPPRGPRPATGRRRLPRPSVRPSGLGPGPAAPPLPQRAAEAPPPSLPLSSSVSSPPLPSPPPPPLASHPFAAEQEPPPEGRRGPSKPRGSGMGSGDAARPPEARLGSPGALLGREHTAPSRRHRRAARGHVTRPFRQRPDLHRAARP